MPSAEVALLHAWLKEHEHELLEDYRTMLRFPSVEGDPEPNAPFGKANRDALNFALQKAQEFGMATKDLEGFIGYAEFGKGERLILSLGHLDVVPTGPGWRHEPFGAEIDRGYVYARGALDDKGPTMASFYAMRAIKSCFPDIEARMRQAFGCNEESGFKCIERYAQTEEIPTFGLAPDSGWPCYNVEKGIANLAITVNMTTSRMKLIEFSGGQLPNIVIDSCAAKVDVDPTVRPEVEVALQDAWDRNVTFAWEGETLGILAVGKAAHGSTPYMGDSAAARVFRFLREISPLTDQAFYGFLFEMTHPSGVGLGIAAVDEVSEDLTANLGIAQLSQGRLKLLFNVRYPLCMNAELLAERCQAKLAKYGEGFSIEIVRDSPPLYFSKDSDLVRTIIDVYEEETGERSVPGVMGGGTYARALPNTISIGTGWDGDGRAHETDERLKVEHLHKMSRIYASIFYRLATLP